MSDGRSRTAGYVVAVVLCVPLAALALFVSSYVGWRGVVVGLGVTGMAALVARRARRIPTVEERGPDDEVTRAQGPVPTTSTSSVRTPDGRIDAEATAAKVDAALAQSSLAYRLNPRWRRLNRATIVEMVRDPD